MHMKDLLSDYCQSNREVNRDGILGVLAAALCNGQPPTSQRAVLAFLVGKI